MIREPSTCRELFQLPGARTGRATPETIYEVGGDGAATYFVREQAVGREQRAYGIIAVTGEAVPPRKVEVMTGAPLLGEPVKTIRRDVMGGTDSTCTVTEVKQHGDLMQVDIGRAKGGKALVAVVAELAGNAVTFIQQVT
ncbi:MAG: hypothetical protein LC775_18345, partial [Acidobacteria bacterium]|nr:hypothetical protein [Acidobacteriota bacterium]